MENKDNFHIIGTKSLRQTFSNSFCVGYGGVVAGHSSGNHTQPFTKFMVMIPQLRDMQLDVIMAGHIYTSTFLPNAQLGCIGFTYQRDRHLVMHFLDLEKFSAGAFSKCHVAMLCGRTKLEGLRSLRATGQVISTEGEELFWAKAQEVLSSCPAGKFTTVDLHAANDR